ncbi:uncharacterized protein N7515_008205 [Penicillium bovifimosum]|uniref:Uncharacterized protein n=1 Tax=Penicillium bovifimosum TaxID=126998 RepID=A0A9W9GP43_9EURO|nr:uncharacterized protein N7515_008205 [Penicillium bovifimosum]KAJ5124380.1 hypothetical protein N7515_008205 [Penicillium bovifimosum]
MSIADRTDPGRDPVQAAELVKIGGEHPEYQAQIQAEVLWLFAALAALKLIVHVLPDKRVQLAAVE